jgi:hypothetical protein
MPHVNVVCLFVCLFVCGRIHGTNICNLYEFCLWMEQCEYNEKSLNVPKGNDVFTHVILQ